MDIELLCILSLFLLLLLASFRFVSGVIFSFCLIITNRRCKKA